MSVPKVAVILCTYNMARYLPESLGSVLALQYPNLEIVVVDDGSTDDTQALIRERYLEKITYVRQDNRGLFAARNAGIVAACDADYYSIADADDKIHPLKVWDEVAFLERHPDTVVCFSNLVRFQEGLENGYVVWKAPDLIGSDKEWGEIKNLVEKIVKRNSFTSVITVRAAAMRAVGNYDATLRCSGDFDLAIRLTRIGGFGFINKVRYLWRCENQGMTSYIRDRIVVHMRIFEKLLEKSSYFSDEELMLLRQREQTDLFRALKGIAAGRVDPHLEDLVQQKLLQNATWRDKAGLCLLKCAAHLGLVNLIAECKDRQRHKRRSFNMTARLEEVLGDMSACFNSITP